AGAATLSLLSGGTVSQSGAGAVTVANLRVDTGGAVSLADNTNAVTTFAAATSDDNLAFRDDGGFAIGTVDGTSGLSLGTGTATLTTTGTATQSQGIVAQGLALLGTGGVYTLTSAANDVDTLAGSTGTVSFTDLDGLSIGTVGATAGLTVNYTTLTLNVGGALGQTAALTGVNRLELTAGGAVDLDVDGVSNTITTLGAVTRSGAFELADSAGGLTLDGVVSAAAAGLSIRTVGDLTVTTNATVAASGAADIALAAQDGEFVNNRGADALSLGTGRFLIYADTRDGSTEGSLSGTREYTRTYAGNPPSSVTRVGNVFLYGNTPIITVTAVDATRVYGDADPTYSVTYSDALSGDDASLAYAGTPGFSTAGQAAGVGTYTLTPTLGGLTSSTGYGFAYVAGTLTVTPASLTVTAAAQSKIYGDADPALAYSVAGLKLNDAASAVLSGSLSRSTGEDVGSYAIGQGGLGLMTRNYALSFNGSTLTISPAALTVTASAHSKVYGDADPALGYSVSGLKFSDAASAVLSGSLSRTAGENVGSYAIGQGGLGLASSNYTLSFSGSTLTINPAPLTLTVADATRLYGAANPSFTATAAGLKNGDTLAALGGATFATAASAASDVGRWTVTPSLSAANYTVSAVAGALTITPAPLTVTALDAAREIGAADPMFQARIDGFVLGQGLEVLGGALAVAVGADSASPVGGYSLTPGGLTSSNYDIRFVAGKLTVKPRSAPDVAEVVAAAVAQPTVVQTVDRSASTPSI
ncbi:MAG TPA: MBG domain-containing protein, partial [Azospirillaceae bacterium]|nr:MBG domain-containing protein [Azospirillaceae bacterium]